MVEQQECWFVRLQEDGKPVIKIHGQELIVELLGIVIPQPVSDTYLEIFRRLAALNQKMMCEILSDKSESVVQANLFYFGWHDKTGDVWQDLKALLIAEGAVTVE